MAAKAKSFDGLEDSFRSRLEALVAASDGKVWLVSGYRSVERQQQLWDAAVRKYGSEAAARKWVAPPGRSNHNHGIAADLGGDVALAARLAPRFGLFRPMSWEPWHFEPTGSRDKHDDEAYTPAPAGEQVQTTESPEAKLAEVMHRLISGGDSDTETRSAIKALKGEPTTTQTTTSSSSDDGSVKDIARRMAAERGWTDDEWEALEQLVQKESSWIPGNVNPSSGTRGLFQFTRSTARQYGLPEDASAEDEVRLGLEYIADRYGSPSKAWAHWRARVPIRGADVGNWY